MSSLTLKFPPLSGGTSIGLNDPGIETFEGDYAHFIVREIAQNSLDAAKHGNSPVRLVFKVARIETSKIGFHSDLLAAVNSSKAYWPKQKKAQRFFSDAASKLNSEKVSFLQISDSGTTGVPGDDSDHNSPWYGLVKSRGVSVKDAADSGGSFGIGKDAPLAGSACRTVLYSTRTIDGEVAFQGVSRLVTHLQNGEETQGTGFIGNYSESPKQYPAIRNEGEIPKEFRRTDNSPGLDIWIVGFKYDSDEWKEKFIGAALANFWPAIHYGRIEFEIADTVISKDSLGELMGAWQNKKPVEAQIPFYRSLVTPDRIEFNEELATAGKCSLYVLLEKDLPRKIAMTRKTGMIIYKRSLRVLRLPFSGLFICDSSEGNALLKTLEPPSHDKWDISRNTEEPLASKALFEINEFIKESLRTLTPNASETAFDEDILAKFIPNLEEENSDLPDINENPEAETALGGRPDKIEGPKLHRAELPVKLKKDEAGGSGHDDGNSGEGSDSSQGKDGDGKNTGGKKSETGEESGKNGGSATKPSKPEVSTRAWASDHTDWDYDLVVRTTAPYSGGLLLTALDENGSEEEILVLKAELIETGTLLTSKGNRIEDVVFSKGEAVKLRIKVSASSKLALRLKSA